MSRWVAGALLFGWGQLIFRDAAAACATWALRSKRRRKHKHTPLDVQEAVYLLVHEKEVRSTCHITGMRMHFLFWRFDGHGHCPSRCGEPDSLAWTEVASGTKDKGARNYKFTRFVSHAWSPTSTIVMKGGGNPHSTSSVAPPVLFEMFLELSTAAAVQGHNSAPRPPACPPPRTLGTFDSFPTGKTS